MAGDVTQLLAQWRSGDREALDRLMPLVYQELRAIAGRYLRNERPGHTLQSTALVHEAYVRLIDQTRSDWRSRAHFFGVAATIIRNILVDHARARNAVKRGGAAAALSLDDALEMPQNRGVDLIAIDDALLTLSRLDPQQSRIVELRFFGGLTIEETAEALGISAATVKRDWVLAKTWIFKTLSKAGPQRQSVAGGADDN
jgi:RNA polymerase sigma factor (TIGR02999 family)